MPAFWYFSIPNLSVPKPVKRKVLICEDHAIVFAGVRLLLEQSDSYTLVGHAATGRELAPMIQKQNPDILLLDLNLPDSDGFTLLKKAKEIKPELLVIILTMYQDEFLLERARAEGAHAYLLKNASNEELLHALKVVAAQSFYITSQLTGELARKKIFKDDFAHKMKLTTREVEIIRLLALGNTSQQASAVLSISPHTVDTHRKNIFRKLEVNNIADLVRFAHESKIL
jgi:DNA-binding NarL/FixJ family response regulator